MTTIRITYLKNQTRHVSTFRGISLADAVSHVERGPVAVWIEGIQEFSNQPTNNQNNQK